MKDLMSYIEDQLDKNGELPSFDLGSISSEKLNTLQENVANSLKNLFDFQRNSLFYRFEISKITSSSWLISLSF